MTQATVSIAAVSPPAQSEDGTLVAAIVHRQPEALEQLYDRYHTMVYHLALRILQSQESAEEVVEEVFWQVWRDAERYEARRGGVGTWLATIARSRAIDALRARRGNPALEDDITENPIPTDPIDDPEEKASIAQRAVLVRTALENLSPPQRAALELSFFRGMSHGEIATHLNEPLGTIKTRLRAAMHSLRARLGPLLGDNP